MRTSRLNLLVVIATATALTLTAGTAKAQTYTWNDTNTDFATGTSWTGGGPNWTTPLNGFVADFGSQSTITNAPIIGATPNLHAAGISFNSSGGAEWTLGSSGGSLSLGANGLVTLGSAGTTTINANLVVAASQIWNPSSGTTLQHNGVLSGSNSIDLNGAGTVVLNGTSNTFTGAVTLSQGTLSLQSSGAIGGTTGSTITFNTVDTGGTLQFNGDTTDYSGRFSTQADQRFKIDVASGSVTFYSPLTSTGGFLTKSGSGTLILAAESPNTLNVTVSGGTLQLGDGAATVGLFNSDVALSNGATLAFNPSEEQRYEGVITGSGNLTKLGSNTLILTRLGSNYSGTTTISEGTLIIEGTLIGSGNVSVSGTLGGYNSGSIAGAVTVNNGGTIRGGDGGASETLTVNNNVTIKSTGILAATIGANETSSSSQIAIVGASYSLDLKTGSILKLTSEGFDNTQAGTYTLATLTDGSNLKLNALGVADGFEYGKLIVGSSQTHPVFIDVSDLTVANGTEFLLVRDGNNLVLHYSPVPEPAAVLGIAVGALALGGLVRRRLRKPEAIANV